ncbi:MAG TPA: NifU family protein [Catalimonadaceae bacterium]|jgi:Fe-S cluster biogenesis protein NfuA|nr:NifU family protein [Catalimonadaceae bacterium]
METNQNLVEKIEKSLDSIRPYLQSDGGNIRVVEVTDEGIVKVEMQGSCISCPMSSMTLKAGVEEAIRNAFPDIKGVEAINLQLEES